MVPELLEKRDTQRQEGSHWWGQRKGRPFGRNSAESERTKSERRVGAPVKIEAHQMIEVRKRDRQRETERDRDTERHTKKERRKTWTSDMPKDIAFLVMSWIKSATTRPLHTIHCTCLFRSWGWSVCLFSPLENSVKSRGIRTYQQKRSRTQFLQHITVLSLSS